MFTVWKKNTLEPVNFVYGHQLAMDDACSALQNSFLKLKNGIILDRIVTSDEEWVAYGNWGNDK